MTNCLFSGNLALCTAKFATTGLSEVPGNSVVDTNDVKGCPGGAGRDDDPRWRWDRRRGNQAVAGLSSCFASPSAHKSLPQKREAADDGLDGCTEWQLAATTTPGLTSKRAATLRSVRAAVRGSNGAARATGDRRSPNERRGGDGAVRWAVGAEVCGAVGCSRSDGLMHVVVDGESRTLCPVHLRRWSA